MKKYFTTQRTAPCAQQIPKAVRSVRFADNSGAHGVTRPTIFPKLHDFRFRDAAMWSLLCLSLNLGNASTLLVYNNNDAGAGSLRQALADNATLGGGNTIVFSNTVTGTITLGSALSLTADVTVLGPGARVLTVSGNNIDRVFDITSGTVSLSGLTIANGGVSSGNGGGIRSSGTGGLTLQSCVLSSNSAAGVGANAGGGALYIQNPCTILNSTFYGNRLLGSSGDGGAIFAYGPLTISNCTFTANVVTNIAGRGGAISAFNLAGNTSIFSSTIASNSAGFSGGGIQKGNGSVFVHNTIIARNSAPADPDTTGDYVSSGYNLIGNAGSSTSWTGAGDQVGSGGSPIDPLLGPLQDNGGATPTMSPLPGSPAMDQGKTGPGSFDQRGRPRPFTNAVPPAILGDHSDIGAVELRPMTLVVSNLNDSGATSLRQTLLDAGGTDGDTITFASSVVGTIILTNGELAFGKNLTIDGPGPKLLAVSGNNSNRVFHVTGGTASLNGLTITGGESGQSVGAGVFNAGVLTISNCFIVGNSNFRSSGAGIYNLSNLVVWNSTIASNNATGGFAFSFGGGLASAGNTVLRNCTVANNLASVNGSGGGIFANGGSLSLSNCTISGNSSVSASAPGGGIYAVVNMAIFSCIVSGNMNYGTNSDVFGSFTSGGYNLVGITNGSSGFGVTGDQFNLNPMLGPLQDNGGPTPTMALPLGSPALDKGKSSTAPTDQRSAPRPFKFVSLTNAPGGDGSDIGAYELSPPALRITRFGSNSILSWPTYGAGFRLQSVSNLPASNNWSLVPGTATVSGSQYYLTNPAAAGRQFYRLIFP